jgi:four helix bundle protein
MKVVGLYRFLRDEKEYVLSKQLLRSGTSIGANVSEALAGESRRDFLHKMSIASKESRETYYWLSLLQDSQLVKYNFSRELDQCLELIRLLTAIVKTTASID